jgi:hypothetical protein
VSNPATSAAKHVLRRWGIATSPWRALPDFMVIGAKRGGTTSMWNYLLDHPLVLPMFPAAQHIKSPHYFYWHFDKGEAWYRSFFATTARRRSLQRRDGAAPVSGEASPYYLYHPYTPQRVRDLVPGVKLIVMLRDPVARAYSHYWERVRAGVEPLSFDEAIAVEDARLDGELARMSADPLHYSRPHDYFTYRDRGVYLPQLQRWHSHFGAEQMLILRSEDFYADYQSTYDEVTGFLGLPRHDILDAKRYNYRPTAPMSAATRDYLTEFYRPHNQALYDYLGRDFGWGERPGAGR